jgi:branched-subunit amino acid ABC-type transport system permease component
MRSYLPFVVIGFATGAVYALAATGLVLTYSTSGVFNFAHGAVGMFATYIFYSLRVDVGVPTALALAIAVLGVGPALGLLLDRVLFRRLEGASAATFIVASLGLLVALQSSAVAIYGGGTRAVAPIFPTNTYRLFGVVVGVDQTIVVAIAVAVGVLLAVFARRTHLGLQTRAVVDDKNLTELVGTNSRFVTSFSWVLGSGIAALSGILFAPFVSLDSLLLTLVVVQAFGAAVVGKLRSFPLANLAAYGIAIAAALATKLVAGNPGLAGIPSAIPVIVLFAVLVFSRKGTFTEVTSRIERNPVRGQARSRPSKFPLGAAVAGGIVIAASAPYLKDSQLITLTSALAFFLVFSSLGLLVGLSRQVSLCHAVFAVFGATTLAHLLTAGVPYVVALILAGVVIVPVGALLALPAIRLSGLFLALATFAFGLLAQNLLFTTALAFGNDGAASIGRPSFAENDQAYFYFVLVVVAVAGTAMELIRVSRLGRILRALGDSPTAIESLGLNPTACRVLIFCISGFFAAIGGALLGSLVQQLNPTSFDFFQSLIWLTVIVACGMMTFGGRVLSVVLYAVVPAVLTSSTFSKWQPVAFGVVAMFFAQSPNGLAGVLFRSPNFDGLAERSAWRRGPDRGLERYVGAAVGRGA